MGSKRAHGHLKVSETINALAMLGEDRRDVETVVDPKKEVSQVLSERVTRFFQYLARIFENGFHEFNLFCYSWIV